MDKLIYPYLRKFRLQFHTLQCACLVVDKSLHTCLVGFCPYTEELVELEYLVVSDGFVAYHLGQGEGENLHLRQLGVGIRVAKVLVVPLMLGTLLHHIVPSVYLSLLIFVEKVEGSARQGEDAGVLLLQFVHHARTGISLYALMRFIHHHEVPIILHDGLFQRIHIALLATHKA